MKTQAQHRLAVFMALSLAIHLVGFIGSQSRSFNSPRQDSRILAVRINKSGSASDSQTKTRSPERPRTGSKPSPLTAQHDKHKNNKQRRRQKPTAFNQLARARILGHIRQRLVRHFVYPKLARRQGWQGRVLLAFQVNQAGAIQRVHIKQSSGYAILDDSAMSALNKIGTIVEYESGLFNQIRQLEIPIIYRLEG